MRALDLFKARNNWLPELIWIGRRDENKRSSKDIKSVLMQKKMDVFLERNDDVRRVGRGLVK